MQGISLDHASSPQVMFVTIKRSKTDPLRQGVMLTLGRMNATICRRWRHTWFNGGDKTGPLFQFVAGHYFTRQHLVSQVHQALHKSGLDSSKYNGHSFRIGAATTAASSDCFKYVLDINVLSYK